MNSPDCSVLVCSCDRYADVLTPFTKLFGKFWPNCPFPKILVTENMPGAEIASVFNRVIACGKGGNWASRLVQALDKIETSRVLMLCDDYLLEAPVQNPVLLRRLEEMKTANAVNLRLLPNPPQGIDRGNGLMEYPKNTAYCVSTLAGFWEVEYLRKLALPVKSIWEFERYGSFAVNEVERPILATKVKEFPFVDAVHKGCWEKFGVAVCRANGIALDLSVRGLPGWKTRWVEGCKRLVFALFPHTWIVRVQNRLGTGAKERT